MPHRGTEEVEGDNRTGGWPNFVSAIHQHPNALGERGPEIREGPELFFTPIAEKRRTCCATRMEEQCRRALRMPEKLTGLR
jgi:hypothetical protein